MSYDKDELASAVADGIRQYHEGQNRDDSLATERKPLTFWDFIEGIALCAMIGIFLGCDIWTIVLVLCILAIYLYGRLTGKYE